MYITGKRPLLSTFILSVAVVKIVAAMTEGIMRILVHRQAGMAPDMMDIVLWRAQIIMSFVQIAAVIIIFARLWKKLKRYLSIFP